MASCAMRRAAVPRRVGAKRGGPQQCSALVTVYMINAQCCGVPERRTLYVFSLCYFCSGRCSVLL